jgi:hypothetical protein
MPQKTQAAVGADQAPVIAGAPKAPTAPEAPPALPAIPPGGGRVVIDRDGDRTIVTSAALPPEVLPVVHMAKDTALGLMGLLAAIIILGPFARMIARRMERKPELKAAENHNLALQQQILQLQQSVDAVSVEVERISESQRFQSKLLFEKKGSTSLT